MPCYLKNSYGGNSKDAFWKEDCSGVTENIWDKLQSQVLGLQVRFYKRLVFGGSQALGPPGPWDPCSARVVRLHVTALEDCDQPYSQWLVIDPLNPRTVERDRILGNPKSMVR
ncbi:hypothetical protein TNCV_5057571 [Trichonephila clavipes]|nr:hypothetical protein TNCV_5057571 [Trichonephila clavipes]